MTKNDERELPSRIKALVVDDEEDDLNLTKIYLKREFEKIEVIAVSSPTEALEEYKDGQFDVVVSDYQMPEMDGIELLENLKSNNGDTPFLIFTKRGGEDVASEALAKGASGYVKKGSDLKKQIESLAQQILSTLRERRGGEVLESEKSSLSDLLHGAYEIGELIPEGETFEGEFDELKELFSVLSKEGTFNILNAVRSELRSERNRWNEFGLSKRQYYLRLRSLKNVNIIEKDREKYVLTDLGERVTSLLFGLGILIKDAVNGENNAEQILEENGIDESVDTSIGELFSFPEMSSARMIDIVNYEGFVSKIEKMIQESEEELLVAVSFADQRIIKEFLNSTSKDFDLKILTSERALSEIQKISRDLLREEKVKELEELLNDSLRFCRNLSFSFALRDQERICVELKNPLYSSNFFLGFVLEGVELSKLFHNTFDELYEGADKPSPSLLSKV